MATRVLLIRAVNVGGAKLPMAELRSIAAGLGATDVSTYIASGNLLCTPPGDPDQFDRALEQAIQERFGYFREVISRSPQELQAALTAHPFEVENPKTAHLHFLLDEPSAEGVAALSAVDFRGDEWRLIGRDLHLRYINGVADSKLTSGVLARKLGVQGTARNLNTIARLIDLAG